MSEKVGCTKTSLSMAQARSAVVPPKPFLICSSRDRCGDPVVLTDPASIDAEFHNA